MELILDDYTKLKQDAQKEFWNIKDMKRPLHERCAKQLRIDEHDKAIEAFEKIWINQTVETKDEMSAREAKEKIENAEKVARANVVEARKNDLENNVITIDRENDVITVEKSA